MILGFQAKSLQALPYLGPNSFSVGIPAPESKLIRPLAWPTATLMSDELKFGDSEVPNRVGLDAGVEDVKVGIGLTAIHLV